MSDKLNVPAWPAETQRRRRGHDFYPAAGSLPALYSTDRVKAAEKLIVAHWFIGSADWWAVEADEAEGLLFGYCCLGDPRGAEWGYASLPELEAISVQEGLAVVERDLHWSPRRFAEIGRHAGCGEVHQ